VGASTSRRLITALAAFGLVTFSGCASSSEPAAVDSSVTAAPAKTDLYYRTFGDRSRQHLVFVHGGPGSNSFMFENAAALLADRGYYVVTYDQRGAARSPQTDTAQYSYENTARDLDDLIKALDLSSPVLLGHSFGGSISLRFMELRPGVARGAVLIGSPMSFPATYLTILENAAVVYRGLDDPERASEMAALEAKMFPRGLVGPFTYSSEDIGTVARTMFQAQLIFPKQPTETARALVADMMKTNGQLLMAQNPDVGNGYQMNNQVGYTDFMPLLATLKDRVFAIYGDEDAIFDPNQLARIASSVTPAHFTLLRHSSHMPFVDQRDDFIEALTRSLAAMP
jgi:proline iminopeptidase